ncbi:MAG: hypothetical protein ACE5NG_12160 [bacterium]
MEKPILIFMICAFLYVGDSRAQQQSLYHGPDEAKEAVDSTAFERDTRSLTGEDLQLLPFRGEPHDYYGLFSGTVVQDFRGTEFLHVRGSRPDELAYTFEGADVRSAFTGLNMIRFIPEALERLTLNASPSASEDNAVGVLEHRLRQSGRDLKFTLRGETDRFTSDYNRRLGTYSYGYFNYLLAAESKIVRDNSRFFAAAERETFDDHYRKFWDGFGVGGPDFPLVDQISGQTLQEVVGTDEIVIQPGNIPNANSERFTINSSVSADFKPLVFRAVGALNFLSQQQNNTPIKDIFNPEHIPEFKQNAGLLSLQADYFGKKHLLAHVQFDLLRSNEKTVDPLFGDNFLLYRDSLAIVEKGVNWDSSHRSSSDSYIQGPGEFNFYQFPFSRPGELLAFYSKGEENYLAISGSVQKKLGNHYLNAGGSFQRRTLRRFAIGSSFSFMEAIREIGRNPDELDEWQLLKIRNSGDVRAFGYDIFGNKIEKNDAVNDAPRHPTNYSLFLEEQFSTADLLLNIGVRYSSFSSDAMVFVDPINPQIEGSSTVEGSNIPLTALESAPSHHFILPRFTAQINPNKQLSFQFQLGKYAQQVRLRDVYTSRAYLMWLFHGGYFINDPRGANAEPVQSTQTEFSVCYRPQLNLNLQTTLFHKTTNGLLETDRIITSPWSQAIDYNVLVNSGESTSKGVELNINYTSTGFRTWVNYTLSDVRGFTSYPISNLRDVELEDPGGFNSKSDPPSLLDFNQKHRGNLLISYKFDKHAPPWLRQTGLHLLFRFNNGHDFTLYDGGFG